MNLHKEVSTLDLTALWESIELTLYNVLHRPGLSDLADILLVAVIIYELLMLTRDTRGSAVLKGLLLLLVVVGISNLFGLTALNWLLMAVINNGPLVLVILFQPEIRKALEQIGRGARLEKTNREDTDESGRIIDEIIKCATNLSRRHVGALIVFEQKTGLKDIIDNGIAIDAQISSGLLENIFEPNTPLHDGAVVIRGPRVMSAACILSLTEASGISHDLGTRHRAALGVSETTDAVVLIVSEETGIISVARGGKLNRHLDAKSLRTVLEGIYTRQRNQGLFTAVKSLLAPGSRKEATKK
ncbi:MAG: diadenylate cyclase CdaA [Clostridia bacterium]|nr:diadenylate cyclase CdaA [Clostridia bacterium]